MTMENQPFEDVFPIKNPDVQLSCLFSGEYLFLFLVVVVVTDGAAWLEKTSKWLFLKH